jgi:hypothetical protein
VLPPAFRLCEADQFFDLSTSLFLAITARPQGGARGRAT